MFDRLLASAQPRRRPLWQTGTSLGVHALIIVTAVWVTRRPSVVTPASPPMPIVMPAFIERSRSTERSPSRGGDAIIARPVFPVVTNVPLSIPSISEHSPVDPSDLLGSNHERDPLAGLLSPPDTIGARNGVVTSAEADVVPLLLESGPRVAPPGMAGVVARVRLQFVISIDGRVEPGSVRVLESSSAAFDASARRVVGGSRYRPGRRNGIPVRVLVEQGVVFGVESQE